MIDLKDHVIDWGTTHYSEAFERQKKLVEARILGKTPDGLFFTEHYPVYTLGKRKGAQDHLIWDEKLLAQKGISLFQSNRGGDITYHGPGQIVGYPIISLAHSQDLHAYLRDLEQVLIDSLRTLGLNCARRPGKTGIWIEERKIAAIGIAVKRWVTYHGFALNVNNDLGAFSGIIPCGIAQEEGSVTSIKKELQEELDLEAIKGIIAIEFSKRFLHT